MLIAGNPKFKIQSPKQNRTSKELAPKTQSRQGILCAFASLREMFHASDFGFSILDSRSSIPALGRRKGPEDVVIAGGSEVLAKGCLLANLDVSAVNVNGAADTLAGRPGCPRAAVIACALGASRASRAGQCLAVGEAALYDIEIAGAAEENSPVPVAAVGPRG